MKIHFNPMLLAAAAAILLSATCAQAQTAAPAPAQTTTPKAKSPATLKPGQFATEAEAKSSCPGDTVVWVNTSSKIYHYSASADYGKTKRGLYMCEKNTTAAGFRVAKNEKKK